MSVKLGTVIQKFTNSPLQLELLLFPDKLKTAKISAALKKRHQEVFDKMFDSFHVFSTQSWKVSFEAAAQAVPGRAPDLAMTHLGATSGAGFFHNRE